MAGGHLMLLRVLQAVESADGPVTLADLSRRLDIVPSALEGMLAYWAGKGRLVVDGRSTAACAKSCSVASCSCGSCSGIDGCPFMARLPRSYALPPTTGRRDE